MIFPEKDEKRIPKTMHECVKPTRTVSELYMWGDRVETWGHRLLVLVIVAGILLTIIEAISLVDVEESMIFPTAITSLVTWAVYAFLTYCAYHIIALVLYALASINHHSMISANVALYQARQEEGTPPAPQVSGGKWKCPECEAQLPYDVIRCQCGYKR